MLDMCYASSAKEYRKQMGGAPDAANLPTPSDEGIKTWENVAKSFDQMVTDIEDALRAAEAAHHGRAADAAKASIAEIKPFAEAAANTSRGVKAALEEQATYQREAFQSLPRQGDKLASGQEAVLDPPQKGWVEDWGLDSNPITGWMSDYEDRQQAYVDTNQQANTAMERYSAQTEGVLARMPEFQPADQPPPPPRQDQQSSTQIPSGYSSNHSTPSSHTSGLSTSATASGTSSSWATSAPHAPSYVPPSSPPSTPPASTAPSWTTPLPGQPSTLPPGVVRGPDGTLFRQNPQTGAWERQNPYNGRWASSPGGGPGGAGMRGGTSGLGSGSGGQLGAGGRAGVGGLGSGTGAGGSAAAGAGARGGAGATGGAGGAGRGKPQGEEDQEHERPSWLLEDDDVFTNDMERTAPPVFGDWSDEGR
ncbi:hypothetical protein [Saccharopolyspora hattusasensis]|uniref:hypothetical protein n=1 Tax=Saccharopolyspora hattusasensis TaxID=1128679 RepID=UPI003D965E8C